MCRWHLGVSLIVLFKDLITLFVLSPITKISMLVSLLWLNLRLHIWEILKVQVQLRWACGLLLSTLHLHPSIWVVIGEKNKSSSKKHLEKCAWTLFFNIILDLSFDCHHVWLRSYTTLGLGVWLYACLITSSFQMALSIFS
jgi:hypothetical protein